jgi:hypothetical protein
MIKHYGDELDENDIFSGCYDVIIKTLLAAEPHIASQMDKLGNR